MDATPWVQINLSEPAGETCLSFFYFFLSALPDLSSLYFFTGKESEPNDELLHFTGLLVPDSFSGRPGAKVCVKVTTDTSVEVRLGLDCIEGAITITEELRADSNRAILKWAAWFL